MSWRHAETSAAAATMDMTVNSRVRKLPTPNFQLPKDTRSVTPLWESGVGRWELKLLRRNFGHSYRLQAFKKLPGAAQVETRIGGFDTHEEPVGRRTGELGNVEHRVIRLRQLVQRPHADERRQRGAEHRRFERHRNELRPAVKGAGADVQRVGVDLCPVLEAESAKAAHEAAQEHQDRQSRTLQPQRLFQLFDRNRRV